IGGGAVLRATEGVDADILRNRDVGLAQWIGVDERTATMPVLGGALRVHHLRQESAAVLLREPAEDGVGTLAERVDRGAVGERKAIGGIEVFLVLAIVPRRLGEAVVEKAQTAASHVRDQTIEDDAILFVGVEGLIEELAQETTAL